MTSKYEKLNKVVISVAGLGIRMLPATKEAPKEMLPLAENTIHHIVNEAIESGFSETIFVSQK